MVLEIKKEVKGKIPWQCGGERGFDTVTVTVSCPDYCSPIIDEIRFLLEDMGFRTTVRKLEKEGVER